MFKKALLALTFLCAGLPFSTAFAMENGTEARLQVKNGRIVVKNEADWALYAAKLRETLDADDNEQVLKLFKGAFALKGFNDVTYQNQALEIIFKNINKLNPDALNILQPFFTNPKQAHIVQQRRADLLTAERQQAQCAEERESARIQLEKEREEARVQLEQEQETLRIQLEKEFAQAEADITLATFYGQIESLIQRIETLDALQNNLDGIIRLQQDINLAISLTQDAFIKNKDMSEDHTQQALVYVENLYNKLQEYEFLFPEQVAVLGRMLTPLSPVNGQSAEQSSKTSEEQAPLSPSELREQRLHYFKSIVPGNNQNDTATASSLSQQDCSPTLDKRKGKEKRPDDQGEESDELYVDAKNAIETGNKNRLKELSRNLASDSPLKKAVDETLASFQPGPSNREQVALTQVNQNLHQNSATNQAHTQQQPWYSRYATVVKTKLTTTFNSSYHWYKTQCPTAVKVGLVAAAIGAYFWYKNYRRA